MRTLIAILFVIAVSAGLALAAVPSAPTALLMEAGDSPLLSWDDATGGTFAWTYNDGTQTGWATHVHIQGVSKHQGAELNVHTYGGGDSDGIYSDQQAGADPFTTAWDDTGITLTRGVLYETYAQTENIDGWGDWSVSGGFKINSPPKTPLSIAVDSSGSNQAGSKASLVAGNDIFVSNAGDDGTGDGSIGNPYETVSFGYSVASPGDRVQIRAGTYNTGQINLNTVGATKDDPITIRGYLAENPTLQHSAVADSGTSFRLYQPWHTISYLTLANCGGSLEGAIYSSASTALGIVIEFCTFTSNDHGIFIRAAEITVRNCDFDDQDSRDILVANLGRAYIFNNTFHNATYVRPIEVGDQQGYIYLDRNVFWDLSISGSEQALISGYQMYNSRITNNLIYDITRGGGNYTYILVQRGANNLIEGNTVIGDKVASAYGVLIRGAHCDVRNNIFHNLTTGVEETSTYCPENDDVTENDYDYNMFSECTTDFADQQGVDIFNDAGYTGNLTTGDIKFTNEGSDDFTLAADSPCVEAGDPGMPVALSGGEARDIGAFERGGTDFASTPGTWTFNNVRYQTLLSTTSATPTLTWTFNDTDNAHSSIIDPWSVNTQVNFNAQLDTANTFDTEDLIDSGTVNSATGGWTIPAADALELGTYYFRVRTADNIESDVWGTWSDGDTALNIFAWQTGCN